jgi:GTP-binding protein HflX
MDVASPQQPEQQAEVQRVLAEIGAGDIPQIWVANKCDLLEPDQRPRLDADWVLAEGGRRHRRVFVSALAGQGLDTLRSAIAQAVVDQAAARAAAVPATPSILDASADHV